MQRQIDGFELRITQQLNGIQPFDIVGVKPEITELQKLADKLHEWLVYPMPNNAEIQPEKITKNIWDVEIKDKKRKKKKNKKIKRLSTEEENIKAVKLESVQSEKDQEMRVQEMVAGDSISRPSKVVDRGIDLVPPPDPPLSAPAITDFTIAQDIPIINGTNIEESGGQLRVHMLIEYEMVPRAPKYVCETLFYIAKYTGDNAQVL